MRDCRAGILSFPCVLKGNASMVLSYNFLDSLSDGDNLTKVVGLIMQCFEPLGLGEEDFRKPIPQSFMTVFKI